MMLLQGILTPELAGQGYLSTYLEIKLLKYVVFTCPEAEAGGMGICM
jgi:hypothetical protein